MKYTKIDQSSNTTITVNEYSNAATLPLITSPNPPTAFRAVSVGFNSVSLEWSTPEIEQSIIREYVVKYNLMDSAGLHIQKGTERLQTFPADSKTKSITSLASGFIYMFNVQVSEIISVKIFRTSTNL